MKYLLLFTLLSSVYLATAQDHGKNAAADKLLASVLQKLKKFSRVSYHYDRETKYHSDNYHATSAADIYIEFVADNPTGLRFQSKAANRRFIYNGQLSLRLDESEMTIDSSAARTAHSMDNNSDLYHSFAMLRNVLPLVIGNDSIQKTVSDTSINGKLYVCVRMEAPKTGLGMFNGIQHFNVEGLHRPCYLVIDTNTGLPYQFIEKYIHGSDARDFATVIYTHINTNPTAPTGASWNYGDYASTYKPFKPVVRKPMIKTGDTVAAFTLPLYTPGSIDSLSLQRYAGKVVLLDFWFKSCGYCMEAMPKYNALQSKFAKQGFYLLTVNITDGVDDIEFFYNKHRPNYPMMFNGGKVFSDLGLIGCPSSVLIGRDGKVAEVYSGFGEKEIEKRVGEMLGL